MPFPLHAVPLSDRERGFGLWREGRDASDRYNDALSNTGVPVSALERLRDRSFRLGREADRLSGVAKAAYDAAAADDIAATLRGFVRGWIVRVRQAESEADRRYCKGRLVRQRGEYRKGMAHRTARFAALARREAEADDTASAPAPARALPDFTPAA